jgi:SNF2 family DNA or RNA helicase
VFWQSATTNSKQKSNFNDDTRKDQARGKTIMLTHNPYAKTKRYRPAQPTSQQHQQPPSAAATNSNHATNSVGTTVVPTKSSDITQTSNVPPAKKPCLISTGRSSAENSAIRQNQSTQPSNSTLGSIRPTSWGQKAGDQPKSMQQKPPSQPNQQRIELPGEAMLPEELSFSPDDVKPIEDGNRKDLVRHANLQKPLLNGWTLYPHQKKSILQCLVKRRMILALDMGLGKTLIGCVWAKSFKSTFDNLKVFVICPVSLKAEWKRTAENTTGLSVEDEKANSNKKSLDLRICSWAKVPTKVESNVDQFVAVFDEAHSMQSMNSARTKDSIKLVLDERYVFYFVCSSLHRISMH